MTYTAHDLSAQDGDPVLLFLFVQGVTIWRYTSAATAVSYDGQTWEPTPIKMSNIEQSKEMSQNALILSFPRGHVFASQFLEYGVEQVTSITIFRGNLSDTDSEFVVYWKGRVISGGGNEGVITVDCEPIFTSLRRPGIRRRYQKLCPHVLFGSECGVDKSTVASVGTATAMVGYDLTVTEAGAMAVGFLIGGMIEYNGVTRYIMNHVGTTVTLIRPVRELTDEITANGDTVITLYPGCQHNYTDCLVKFDNLINYGGFPWLPSRNPFEFHSLV